MKTNELADAGIVTQLAVVHTMLPKVKKLIDDQVAEIDRLKVLCVSYIDEEWSGTSSYQKRLDEVNGKDLT
jgi:hypothetical protein